MNNAVIIFTTILALIWTRPASGQSSKMPNDSSNRPPNDAFDRLRSSVPQNKAAPCMKNKEFTIPARQSARKLTATKKATKEEDYVRTHIAFDALKSQYDKHDLTQSERKKKEDSYRNEYKREYAKQGASRVVDKDQFAKLREDVLRH